MTKILKWDIPVDDQTHRIGNGRVVHIASQRGRITDVQVWTQEESAPVRTRSVMVVGTGHDFPNDWEAVGSVVVSNGNLVWHVIQRTR